MRTMVSYPAVTWSIAMLLATSCGRTTATNGAAEAATALVKAEEATAGTAAVSGTVTTLESRVTSIEESVGEQGTRLTATEDATSSLGAAQTDLTGRVEVLEGQDVVEAVNSAIASGVIDVTFEPAFAPPIDDVDPRADPADAVPEYGSSTTLAQAVSALRYANQIRYSPRGDGTRLGALERNHVQEAIDALDRELHQLLTGGATLGLDTTSLPQDGSYNDIQSAVEDLHRRLRELERGPYVLGVTDPTSGLVTHNGRSGILGAAGLCQAKFPAEPDAHLCSLEEAREALAASRVATDIGNVTTWALGATLGEGCDGLRDAAPSSFGTTHVLDVSSLNATALGVGTTTEACNIQHPLLCCR